MNTFIRPKAEMIKQLSIKENSNNTHTLLKLFNWHHTECIAIAINAIILYHYF